MSGTKLGWMLEMVQQAEMPSLTNVLAAKASLLDDEWP